MRKIISLVVISGILLILSIPMMAQNSTNSPYTRYGYGDLANRSFGAGRSMGGVGIGLRSSKQINPMNPASYSSMDSMTFLFDFGATAQLSWFNDGVNSQNNLNGNVEYMAMQFPLHRKIAMSVGLLPYSHVGYTHGEWKISEDGLGYHEKFTGTGGLNLLYAGLSIDIWEKRLSIGTNINYLFGTNTYEATSTYSQTGSSSIRNIKMHKLSGATFDLGLQYTHPLSNTERVVFGVTYAPKIRLNNSTYETVTSGSETVRDTLSGLAYDKPMESGFGVSYVKDDKLLIVADFSYQGWGDALIAGKNDDLKNRIKVSTGLEYIPNLYSRPYLNRTRYRFGVNYTNSYIQINGNSYNEYGATVGAGFPISDLRSFINVSFEYVKINSKEMINEDYLRMTLSYTFNELWFFKRKVN